jgi:hypothetical protein
VSGSRGDAHTSLSGFTIGQTNGPAFLLGIAISIAVSIAIAQRVVGPRFSDGDLAGFLGVSSQR